MDDPTGKVLRDGVWKPVKLGIGSQWICKELAMEFVYIPAGTFLMGAQKTDPEAANYDEEAEDDAPVHAVVFKQGFWLGRFPVTNVQYRRYVSAGGEGGESLRQAGFNDPQQPVTGVSWYDAQAFCKWASQYSPQPMVLPTETEWEYAARGQDGRRYSWGNEAPDLKKAWYGGYGWSEKEKKWKKELGEHKDQVQAPAVVGGRVAGPFGAEDLSGNVWEWCVDPYEEIPLEDDKVRQTEDKLRVVRGGSWFSDAGLLRAAFRRMDLPRSRVSYLGFRVLVRVPAL